MMDTDALGALVKRMAKMGLPKDTQLTHCFSCNYNASTLMNGVKAPFGWNRMVLIYILYIYIYIAHLYIYIYSVLSPLCALVVP